MTTVPIRDLEAVSPLRSELVEARISSNARWGAIVGGVVMATALWVVLHIFGMGVGLTAIDPEGTNSIRSIGIGTGIWSVIAPMIALFVGGLVVSRLAPSPSRLSRAIHGGLVWAVAALASVAILFLIASSVVRGAAAAGGRVVGAVSGVVADGAGAIDSGTLKSLGIDADELLGPINHRLRADGKPIVTAAQLEAATKDVLGTAVRTGSIDRPMLVKALADNTALARADADEIATALEARWQNVRHRAAELATRARTAALQAAKHTGKALMGLSAALFLGLAAAVGGALLTGHNDRRRRVGYGSVTGTAATSSAAGTTGPSS
jgi:hypothetical protein